MQKFPILVLHGWNLSSEKFSPLINALKEKGYIVEAVDLPGFGKSKIPERAYFLSDYMKFVEDYIVQKKWKEAVIIGHSFGGRIGIKLASQHPEFLKALILTGAPGFNPVPRFKILFFSTLAKLGNSVFALPLVKNIKALSRHLLYRAANAMDFYTTNINMQDTFKNVVAEDLSPYLSKITVPTLLIWGENDLIVPLDIGKRMEKIISRAKLVSIPDARHGVPWTHAEEFSNFVKKFIESL